MEALENAFRTVFSTVHAGMQAEQIDEILRSQLRASEVVLLPSSSSPFVVAKEGAPPKLRVDRVPLRRDHLWGMDTTVRWQKHHADDGTGMSARYPKWWLRSIDACWRVKTSSRRWYSLAAP
jgi:hypothetical protein